MGSGKGGEGEWKGKRKGRGLEGGMGEGKGTGRGGEESPHFLLTTLTTAVGGGLVTAAPGTTYSIVMFLCHRHVS